MATSILSNIKKKFTDFFKAPAKDEVKAKTSSGIKVITKARKDFATNLNLNLGEDTEAIDDTARLMEKTEPDLLTATQIRIAAIMSLNTDIKGKGAGLGEPVEFIKTWWDGLSNKYNTVRALLKSAITRGFGVVEREWKYIMDSGKWTIDKLICHSIKHHEFNEDNRLLLKGDTSGSDITVDESKYFSVLTFQEDDQNRYGIGLYEQLYWYWYLKNNSMKFWAIFTERKVDPNLIAKLGKRDENVEAAIETFFNDQMTGANLVIPSQDVIIEVLHKIEKGEVSSYETFCRYLDAKFHISIIGNTASMDTVKTGVSFDSGTVPQRVRFDILWSDVKWFETWLNEFIIYPLAAINFPNINPGDVYIDIMIGKNIDPSVFKDVVTSLHGTGTDLPKNHVFEQFGIPGIKEGEDIIPGLKPALPAPNNQTFSDKLEPDQIEYLSKLKESLKK